MDHSTHQGTKPSLPGIRTIFPGQDFPLASPWSPNMIRDRQMSEVSSRGSPSFSSTDSESRRCSSALRRPIRSPTARGRKSDKSLKEKQNRKDQRETLAALEDEIRIATGLQLPASRQLHPPNTGSSGLMFNKDSTMAAAAYLLAHFLEKDLKHSSRTGRLSEWRAELNEMVNDLIGSSRPLEGTVFDIGPDGTCTCSANMMDINECRKCRFELRTQTFWRNMGSKL